MQMRNILKKMCFSALFIALGFVLSRLVSLPYLFGLPFLKISLAPSVVMFSSIYLGPLWGLFVGTAVDVIGALAIPQGGGFNPLFTIAASLTGLMPGLVYKLFSKKVDKDFPISLTVVLSIIWISLTVFFSVNNQIVSESGKKVYEITPLLRFIFIGGSYILSALYIFGVYFIKNKFKNSRINKKYNIYAIGTAIFVTYFIFKIPVSSIVKSFVLEYSFTFVFTVQSLVGVVACFVHIILVTVMLNIASLFNIENVLAKRRK